MKDLWFLDGLHEGWGVTRVSRASKGCLTFTVGLPESHYCSTCTTGGDFPKTTPRQSALKGHSNVFNSDRSLSRMKPRQAYLRFVFYFFSAFLWSLSIETHWGSASMEFNGALYFLFARQWKKNKWLDSHWVNAALVSACPPLGGKAPWLNSLIPFNWEFAGNITNALTVWNAVLVYI